MENQNGNGLNDLKKSFADYQKKQAQSTTRKSREDILAKYFVPRKTKEIFRILPPKQGRKHIQEAFFHVVTTNGAGGKKKHGTVIYCPAHNDPKVKKLDGNGNPILDSNNQPILIQAPCPLCTKHKRYLSKQDSSIKYVKKDNMTDAQLEIKTKNDEIYKEAIKWEAKKFYIIRGIDKGAEKDGVKFWRFKHNYKNQGTLDKLLPILEEYVTVNDADFSDAKEGTDLSIIMTDSEFNGHVYKAISAITFRGKSLLHADPIVARQWLDDDIIWRDVFQPKKAPNVTPYEFLEMVATGNNPYWDDVDANNKHWVFPGRPDLEEAANNRQRNLDANDEEEFEMASDLLDEEYPRTTISNMNESKIGEYKDDSIDLGAEALKSSSNNDEPTQSSNYDDLPF